MSAEQAGQIQAGEALRVGQDVDLGDPVPRDGQREQRQWLRAGCDDGARAFRLRPR
jgi:hypothetical protein